VKENHYIYDWSDVENAAHSIIEQMFRDNWRPDYIVGITRGGLPLATLLSHCADCRLETLKVKLRDIKPGESCESNLWMADDAFGIVDEYSGVTGARWDILQRKNILIVDDINDTGATFEWIKKDWQSSCFPGNESWDTVWNNNVRFAVMTENLASNFKDVRYSWDKVDKSKKDVWLIYPYERV
jgi:hypoxanthine phosphoribosyltransferase